MNGMNSDRRGFLKKLALIVLASGMGSKALAGIVRNPRQNSASDRCKDCPFKKPSKCSSAPDTCGCPHTKNCRLKLDAQACRQCPVRAGLISR
jgi:hypothetical protein